MNQMRQQPAVLLVEPNAIVATDLSDALETAGYRVLGPCATTDEALQTLERETPTLVVLDVMLRDGPCIPLSLGLRQREIPFLVHTSVQHDEPAAANFRNAPWLSKPALPWDVVTLVDELAASVSRSARAETASPPQVVQAVDIRSNPFVLKLESFTALSDEDRALLERISAHPRTVAARTDLIREGDKPNGVFLVLEGMAYRHKVRETGERQIMAYLVPGDLGDLDVALLDVMDHTITTLSVCKVVRLAPETIADLTKRHPRIARALRMGTLVDEATLREWLMNVGRRSGMERIAHLFCELQVRMQAVGLASNNGFALPLTQADLANTTGMSSVHVNRMLQELRRESLIELRQGRLRILDLPRLRAVAEFKANYLHLGERAAV